MSGLRRASPHSTEHKLTAMTQQELTPNPGKNTDGVHASLDVFAAPSKRSLRLSLKPLVKNNQHSEGSAAKRACLSSETRSVRRPLIALLSRLKAESDHLEMTTVDSDQESLTDSRKSRRKTTFSSASTHNILNISSKNTPAGSLKEDTTDKTIDIPAEMSCGNKRLVVNLVRLREESRNLEEETFEETCNDENDLDQQKSGSSIPAASSSSALRTRNRSTTKLLRRSLRKNIQADPLEEGKKLSLEADCAENLLANPNVVEEKPSTDESDSEGESDQEQTALSAYERERMKNIKANVKFLNSIKLLTSAASLHSRKKNQNRVVKREKPQNTGNTVVRRSMRLQNVAPSQVKVQEQAPTVEEYVKRMKPPGPIEMIPIDQQNDHNTFDQFLRTWTSLSQETVKAPTNKHVQALKSYEASMKKMTLRGENVAKVVSGRILSVAIHPSERQTLVASGDKYGNVGLWNLEDHSSDMGIYKFEVHSRSVACLSFCPWNSAHLLSLSYDGSVHCGDVTRCVFDEIYRDEEENFSSFDYLSADGSVLIVSDWDSQLSLVDRRTPGVTYEVRAHVDLSGPRTVSVHPLQRDLCAVAGAGDVCVYDVRQLSRKKTHPVISLPGHTRVVHSAYFSPVTGNRIVTTGADDRLRVYDSSSVGSTVPLLTSIRHNNFTGRWLSRFRAVWDPKQEDCFVVGSMERPRQIQVFHEDGKLVHVFWDSENLNSVCSINANHPTRSIIVGGNSSGRLHVFRNQSE